MWVAGNTVAGQIHTWMNANAIDDIVVETHSFGGVVIRWILSNPTWDTRYQPVIDRIRWVNSIAGPHKGSEAANLAGTLSGSWLTGWLVDLVGQNNDSTRNCTHRLDGLLQPVLPEGHVGPAGAAADDLQDRRHRPLERLRPQRGLRPRHALRRRRDAGRGRRHGVAVQRAGRRRRVVQDDARTTTTTAATTTRRSATRWPRTSRRSHEDHPPGRTRDAPPRRLPARRLPPRTRRARSRPARRTSRRPITRRSGSRARSCARCAVSPGSRPIEIPSLGSSRLLVWTVAVGRRVREAVAARARRARAARGREPFGRRHRPPHRGRHERAGARPARRAGGDRGARGRGRRVRDRDRRGARRARSRSWWRSPTARSTLTAYAGPLSRTDEPVALVATVRDGREGVAGARVVARLAPAARPRGRGGRARRRRPARRRRRGRRHVRRRGSRARARPASGACASTPRARPRAARSRARPRAGS